MEQVLSMLGLARKAGRVEIGEEAVGAAAHEKHARVILLARDAAPTAGRRAAEHAAFCGCPLLTLEADKDALGQALGFGAVAVAAVTDFGLAAAVGQKLAALDSQRYGEAAGLLQERAERNERRKQKKLRRTKEHRADGRKAK
ncbi:MAG: 50S ribosomal protein L7 [Oscillospiraceae bacterium]|nr:50S ribosomal protein L7 [Oscillospiraceae bacterium]